MPIVVVSTIDRPPAAEKEPSSSIAAPRPRTRRSSRTRPCRYRLMSEVLVRLGDAELVVLDRPEDGHDRHRRRLLLVGFMWRFRAPAGAGPRRAPRRRSDPSSNASRPLTNTCRMPDREGVRLGHRAAITDRVGVEDRDVRPGAGRERCRDPGGRRARPASTSGDGRLPRATSTERSRTMRPR